MLSYTLQIEFFDGLVLSKKVVSKLDNRESTIDFAVCNSAYLAKLAFYERDQIAIGSSEDYIPLSIWLAIYAATFEIIIDKKLNFDKAFSLAVNEAKNKLQSILKKYKNAK